MPAPLAMTADHGNLLPDETLVKAPQDADESNDPWFWNYVDLLRDLRRAEIELEELLYDFPLDKMPYDHGTSTWEQATPPELRRFPRRWVLAAGALEPRMLGDEMHCNLDGSVEARSTLLLHAPLPAAEWCWELALDRRSVRFRYPLPGGPADGGGWSA